MDGNKNAILKIRVKDEMQDKLDIIETYMRRVKDNPEQFYSQGSLVNQAIDYFMEQKGISHKHMESNKLQNEKQVLKHMRVDTNIPKSVRSNIKNLCKGMVEENMIEKKPKIQEFLSILIKDYVQANPQLKQYMNIDENLKQRIEIENIKNKRYGLR